MIGKRQSAHGSVVWSVVLISLISASCAKQSDTNRRGADPLRIYSSPTAVFDAYQNAQQDRNWRKCCECLTPRAQNVALFEIVFQSGLSEDTTLSEALNKYIIDEGTLSADVRAKSDRTNGSVSTEAPDVQLLADTLAARIIDKAAFFETGSNLLFADDSLPPFGKLENLTIEGHTATGRAATVITHLESSGGPSKTVEDMVYQTFTFRFVNGQWLIDSP